MTTCPLDAQSVARKLGIAVSTLNDWLARDARRHPDDRRLSFHRYRGRKRIWTPDDFARLEAAVEQESEPGGALGRWRIHGAASEGPVAKPTPLKALHDVLHFKPGIGAPQRLKRPGHNYYKEAEPLGKGPIA